MILGMRANLYIYIVYIYMTLHVFELAAPRLYSNRRPYRPPHTALPAHRPISIHILFAFISTKNLSWSNTHTNLLHSRFDPTAFTETHFFH